MTKKVRFDDNVQVKKMSINLTEHSKEVKLAKDIIINPDKTLLPNIEMLDPDIETEKVAGYKDKMFDIPYTLYAHDPPFVYRLFGDKASISPNFFFWILAGVILIIILGIFSVTNTGKRILLGRG